MDYMTLTTPNRIDQPQTRACANAILNAHKTETSVDTSAHTAQLRVALYSHDTMGVGHMRRNLLIAQSLIQSGGTVLMVAGAKEANAFAVPQGVDCLTLPALRKDLSGRYHSRSLNLPMSDAIRVRSAAIQASVNAFDPDVLIVDKVPRGIADELMPTLDTLRRRGRTRCVLGLRDVLDEKSAVLEDWRAARTLDVIRQHFDEVWVYGDDAVFDFVNEYDLPDDVAAKVRYTGYLDQSQRAEFDAEPPESSCIVDFSNERFNLCLVGGGQDGASLATTFSQAIRQTDSPAVLLTGPYMPSNVRQELLRDAANCPALKILEFVPEADWLMSRAARVVAMAGYNTACSILSFGKPALVVPRILPRREQLVRAQRLRELGLIDMLHPDALSPQALADWLNSPLKPTPPIRDLIDLNGLANIRLLVEQLVCRKLERRSK